MRYILIGTFILLCIRDTSGQRAEIRSWGLQLSPAKYYFVKFAPSQIYLPAFGTIATQNSSAFMFRTDITLNFSRLRKRTLWGYGIGLATSEYTMNSEAIQSATFNQQSIIVSNYTLRPNLYIGYLLAGNRSIHILIKTGLYYSIATFRRDYNYVNGLIKWTFRDEIAISVLGEPLVINMKDAFSIPRTTVAAAIQFELRRISVDFCIDYSSINLELFKNTRPSLVKEAIQGRLAFTFLFGNKYLKK